jgi:ATP-dependent Clp protease ATP-binding subunit ClpX
MLDVMYDLPQTENVDEVVINRSVVEGRGKPKFKFHKAVKATKSKAAESQAAESKEADSSADAA